MKTDKAPNTCSDEHCREIIDKITNILGIASDAIAIVLGGESPETREIVVNALVENELMKTLE